MQKSGSGVQVGDRVAGQSQDRFRVGVVADTIRNNESTDETHLMFFSNCGQGREEMPPHAFRDTLKREELMLKDA